MADWFVYVLRCGDGTLYTGITTDVSRRLSEHASGGPKATAGLWGQLGVARHALGRHAEAGEAFARALALDPDYFKGRPNQARCRQASADGRSAI